MKGTTTKTTTKKTSARKVLATLLATGLIGSAAVMTTFAVVNHAQNGNISMTKVSAESVEESTYSNIVDTTPNAISNEHNEICWSINSESINYYDVLMATKGTHTVIVEATGDVGARVYNGRKYNESARGIKVNGLPDTISSDVWDDIYANLKQDFENSDVSIIENIPNATQLYLKNGSCSKEYALSAQAITGIESILQKADIQYAISNISFEIIK